MRAISTIDHAGGTVHIELTLERKEDGAAAIDVVAGACTALWPDIEFDAPGDPQSQNSGPAAKGARKPCDFSKPPRDGSVTARVLEACRRLRTTDFHVVADELDLVEHVAAAAIANLRKGGHLK